MRFGLIAALAFVTGAPAAAPASAPAEKEIERDVPYLPTPQTVVDAMLKLAEVGPGDFHIDLGCGDGRIVVSAARDRGARGLGVDIDPKLITRARHNAVLARVSDQVEFRRADLFRTDISGASVLTLYLLPAVNMRLRPTILSRLKPGTRVVSHDFHMGDWPPDRQIRIKEEGSDIYLWIVPATVAGRWRLSGPGGAAAEVALEQRFQILSGGVREGRVTGDRVRFTLPDGRRFAGRVDGETMMGEGGWRGTRTGDLEG